MVYFSTCACVWFTLGYTHVRQVETEELMEGRFVVKMEWSKRDGIGGHVQRVIEGLDLRMISIVVYEKNPDVMSSTAFVEVISQHFDL